MKEVTLIVTDNNRVDLLRRTLSSFFEMNTYPIKEVHIHNDGKDKFFKGVMQEYPQAYWYFSGRTIGYAASLDFLLSKVTTEYVMTLESDWHFFQNPGFIERSMKILEENPHIHQCWIRDPSDHGHPLLEEIEISGIKVREVKSGYRRHWNGYSLNPALRRMCDIKTMFPNGLVEHRDEIDQAIHSAKFNYKAVSLVESSIRHIGYGRRSINFRA
jgi:hypothetical protein